MPEKLWPPPIEALASRQDEVAAWWAWRWCRCDLAEASVMPPPSRTVPATRASAARDRVGFPDADFFRFNMYQVPQDSIATYVTSGTPVPLSAGLLMPYCGAK